MLSRKIRQRENGREREKAENKYQQLHKNVQIDISQYFIIPSSEFHSP